MTRRSRILILVLSIGVAAFGYGQEQPAPPANPQGTPPTPPTLDYTNVVTLKCLNVANVVLQGMSGQSPATVATIGPLTPGPDSKSYSCDRNGPIGMYGTPVPVSGVGEAVWSKTDSEKMYKNLQKEVLAAVSKAVKDSFVSKDDLKAAVAEEIRKEHDLLKAEILAEISAENQAAKSKGQTNSPTTLSMAATQ